MRHGPLRDDRCVDELTGGPDRPAGRQLADGLEAAQAPADLAGEVRTAAAARAGSRHTMSIGRRTASVQPWAIGIVAVIVVPSPDADRTSTVPPREPIRSRMLCIPTPRRAIAGSNPTPSSITCTRSSRERRHTATRIEDAVACFTAFWIASAQQ